MSMLAYEEWQSPIGMITIVADNEKLYSFQYGSFKQNETELIQWSKKYQLPTSFIHQSPVIDEAIKQLTEYFNGERKQFSVDYVLHGTSFQKKVWHALSEIPYGKTCSYQDIARKIGTEKAVRAVGGANNKNPISIIIPCHRVIGKNGKMVGYGGGLDKKEYLLKLEELKG